MALKEWIINTIDTCPATLSSKAITTKVGPWRRGLKRTLAFIGGYSLGQLYYHYLLKKIPFPGNTGFLLSVTISLLLGICNVACVQLRCISALTVPMYCGKPGRGLLKAVVLTYVIAGPITNMCLNAKEVVRVFACSTLLSHDLSGVKTAVMGAPFRNGMFSLRAEMSQFKDTFKSIRDVVTPIEMEIEGSKEQQIYQLNRIKQSSNLSIHKNHRRKTRLGLHIAPQDLYLNKLEQRCESMLSHAVAYCTEVFASSYHQCLSVAPECCSGALCDPFMFSRVCNWRQITGNYNICDSNQQSNPGLGEGYASLKTAKRTLCNSRDVAPQYTVNTIRELYNTQDAKETGDRVMHAFEEKYIVMCYATVAVDICVALLFLRIAASAVTYHDRYLTSIEHDNVYVTGYFKKIDRRRRRRGQFNLLPFKKMERIKYVDIHSLAYMSSEREKLVTHILKVLLEVVTATTFVMLDRLFFEALDVVRQHAATVLPPEGTRDLEIEVEGVGTLATMVRHVLDALNVPGPAKLNVNHQVCQPRPRLMPSSFYLKIYGGYLWILFLLYINPYTVRLRRLVCSCFYPRREKQRILHLYNDILKKRLKMQKTLRRKAVQAVRAHYLSGENLLSLRMKFPRLLGWLRALPAARMTCLICGETEPRRQDDAQSMKGCAWHSCTVRRCPFVYCVECWREVGARCLACDPSLAELSDVDSLSEDELKY